MKKGWKIFWIVCAVLFCTGIVFCIAGGAMGASAREITAALGDGIVIDADFGAGIEGSYDSDYGHHDGSEHGNPDSAVSYSGVKELDIDVAGVELEILPSWDEDVHVETEGMDSRMEYSCGQEDETLEITTVKKLRLINQLRENPRIWVYLPERELDEADISNQAGVLYAEIIRAGELKIDIGAGQGTIEEFLAQDAELVCGAGQMTASGTAFGGMDIECGVGEIDLTLEGREEDYSYSLDCGVGQVNVGEHSFSGVGHEYQENREEGRELSIDCGVGKVSVYFSE